MSQSINLTGRNDRVLWERHDLPDDFPKEKFKRFFEDFLVLWVRHEASPGLSLMERDEAQKKVEDLLEHHGLGPYEELAMDMSREIIEMFIREGALSIVQ
jgi:hypothetical protein